MEEGATSDTRTYRGDQETNGGVVTTITTTTPSNHHHHPLNDRVEEEDTNAPVITLSDHHLNGFSPVQLSSTDTSGTSSKIGENAPNSASAFSGTELAEPRREAGSVRLSSRRQGARFAPSEDVLSTTAAVPGGGERRRHTLPLLIATSYDYDDGPAAEAAAAAAMMTSGGGGATVTFEIEESGTVTAYDRLSLDSGGDRDAADGRKSLAISHCHLTSKDSGMDKKARFKLILASLLCLVFMIGECVGGVLAHSLAVVSDAAHLLTDFASFMISLMALYLASRPATKRLSFGWYRAEILGALVSILMLWVITGVLCYSAVLRVQSGDYEIDATIMLITSATGVVFNVVLGCTLHQHGHSHGGGGHSHGHGHSAQASSPPPPPESHTSVTIEEQDQSPLIPHTPSQGYGSISSVSSPAAEDKTKAKAATTTPKTTTAAVKKKKASNINVKAAFIHVLGDFCQSVGVLVAAFIIFFKPEWKIADPICTFLFSVLVLVTTISILRDILVVLMEGTPRNINFEEVRDSLLNMEGVKDLHDLRVWSLTMDKTALSVHLAIERGLDPMQVVKATSRLIQHQYNITQTTIQVEEYVDEMRDCTRCQHLKD